MDRADSVHRADLRVRVVAQVGPLTRLSDPCFKGYP